MSDEIKTRDGHSVGAWNGVDAHDLKDELMRIRKELRDSGSDDRMIPAGVPHRDQLPEDLHSFKAYPIWGHDQHGHCVCGARANRIVSVEDVRQYSMVEHH